MELVRADFNAKVGREQIYKHKKTNENVRRLIDFASKIDLKIAGIFF